MSNIKPGVTITVTDPKLFERIAEIKADTEAIKLAMGKVESPVEEPPPRYFPKGYFS
jgi:hypothetical protein